MPKRDELRRIDNVQARPATSTLGVLKSVTQPPTPNRDLGSWTVGDRTLSAGDLWLHGDGWIRLGADHDMLRLDVTHPSFRVWAGNADPASAPFRVTKEGALTATNATLRGHIEALTGELRLLSILDRLTLATGGEIVSANYAAGVAGLRIGAEGNIEAHNLWARGRIQTAVFEREQISASAGSLLITPDAGALAANYTAGGTLTIAGAAWAFATGDNVRIRALNTAGAVAETWLTVTRLATVNQYSTVVRSGDAASTWPAGTAALGYRQGGGSLLLTALLAGGGPFYSVRTHGAAPWTGEVEQARLGNLNGAFGIAADRYGVGLGDFATGNFLRYEPTGGLVLSVAANAGLNLRLDTSSIGHIQWTQGGISLASLAGYANPGIGGGIGLILETDGTAIGRHSALLLRSRDSVVGSMTPLEIDFDTRTGIDFRVRGSTRLNLSNTALWLSSLPILNSTPLGCVVFHSLAQPVANNAFVTLTPNTEQHDFGNCWAPGTPERFIAPEDGYYSMSAHIEWVAGGNVTGFRELIIQHRDHPTAPTFAHNLAWQKHEPAANVALGMSVAANRVFMAAGTYLIVVARQTSGVSLNIAAATVSEIYRHSMRFARVA